MLEKANLFATEFNPNKPVVSGCQLTLQDTGRQRDVFFEQTETVCVMLPASFRCFRLRANARLSVVLGLGSKNRVP